MTAQKQREIVIEFEKIHAIRKRAKTTLADCRACGAETDFVSLLDAAALFETAREDLFDFVHTNDCHYHVELDDRVYLCVTSLLERMQRQSMLRRLTP